MVTVKNVLSLINNKNAEKFRHWGRKIKNLISRKNIGGGSGGSETMRNSDLASYFLVRLLHGSVIEYHWSVVFVISLDGVYRDSFGIGYRVQLFLTHFEMYWLDVISQVMLIFLQNMNLLLSKTTQDDIRNHVLPMITRALEAGMPQMQAWQQLFPLPLNCFIALFKSRQSLHHFPKDCKENWT